MTPEQLDQIQARADAATEGPWDRPLNTRYRASVTANMPKGDPSSRWRDQVDHKGNPERVSIVSCPIWSDGKFMRKQSGRDLEFIAAARTDVPALLAYARDLEARLGRVEKLASMWEARGEHDMAFSKTLDDENISTDILGHGAQMVENARHIRNALNNEGATTPEQPEILLEDTDPATVFTISLSVADAVDAIEDHLRNDDLTDLNTAAVNIWGLLIDASSAALTATEGQA